MTTTNNNNNNVPTDKCITTSVSSYPKTIVEALKPILTDEKISDIIYLKGNDGINVPACKCMLAAWSPVFRNMLYKDYFVEASANVIDINYPSDTIQKLVEFCYTEKVEFIDKLAEMDEEELDNAVEVRHIDEITLLLIAANYYLINQLEKYLKDFLHHKLMHRICWTSCYILEEAGANDELRKISLDFIREYPELVFDDDDDEMSLRCLSPEILSVILRDDDISASESFIFSCLQRWADLELESDQKKDKRRKDAMAMVEFINLARIPPSKLFQIVKSSGLVDDKDLRRAYKKQALSRLLEARSNFFSAFDLFLDLHRSKFAGAIKVTVQGAGVAGVNGTYVLDNVCDGGPEYYKVDVWSFFFKDRMFKIYYGIVGWQLSLAMGRNGDIEEIIFFSESKDAKNIPTAGWKAKKDEHGPAPTFTYTENEI